MAPQLKSTIGEWSRVLIIPILSGLVTAAFAVGTFKSDFKALENRVEENRLAHISDLSNAISMRKADSRVIEQRITDGENRDAAINSAFRDMMIIIKESARDSAATKEAVARLEVTVSYLAKGQDEIKSQLGPRTK